MTLDRPAPSGSDGHSSCPICDGPTELDRDGLYDDRYGYPGTFSVRRCRRCGHRFVAASFSEDELLALYADFYPRGELRLEQFKPRTEVHGFAAWLEGEQASAFRWVPRDVRVLDIGCGFGESLAYHAARGCDAHGIDADANLLRVAERYGLNARVGLFDAADYDPGSFDYVTLDQVIEHATDPRQVLAGVATVLRPGGTAIVATPNAGGYGRRMFGDRWINWHIPYHLHHFTRASLRRLASTAGLEVVSMRTVTNSRWLWYQGLHLADYPPPGSPSRVWDPRRSTLPRHRRRERYANRLYRFRVVHVVARATDLAGSGDNLLCVLRRPA